VLLAADEASVYLQASLMRVWAPKGQTPLIRVAANRDNTHFYGALNLATGQEVILRSDIMKAETSALFLSRVLSTYPDKPILLLWDRAPWHKGAAIRSVLSAHPRLEILWFPPGCPELNPQEHVWKAVREAVSHNQRPSATIIGLLSCRHWRRLLKPTWTRRVFPVRCWTNMTIQDFVRDLNDLSIIPAPLDGHYRYYKYESSVPSRFHFVPVVYCLFCRHDFPLANYHRNRNFYSLLTSSYSPSSLALSEAAL